MFVSITTYTYLITEGFQDWEATKITEVGTISEFVVFISSLKFHHWQQILSIIIFEIIVYFIHFWEMSAQYLNLNNHMYDHNSDCTPKWESCIGKVLEKPKVRPRDTIWDMGFIETYIWGVQEEPAGQGCALLLRTRRELLKRGEETETTCFARKDPSCATSSPRNKTLVRGFCVPLRCFHW